MIRLQGFRIINYKFGSGQESKLAAVTKKSKTIKINFFSRTIRYIISYKFDGNINRTLVFTIMKIEKKKKEKTKKKNIKKKQQSKVAVTYFVFTSPILLKCQYLEKTLMYFVQIRSQWSLIGTISYLCK